MPRPTKLGLDYFPLDVDIFDDTKMAALSLDFGLKGELAAIKLLCAVYREGYFALWSDAMRIKLRRQLPGVSDGLLTQIVTCLARWGFFDEGLLRSDGILTSRGIQRRYFEAKKLRGKGVPQDYPYVIECIRDEFAAPKSEALNPKNRGFLQQKPPGTGTKTAENGSFREKTPPKVKERKEKKKESKEKTGDCTANAAPPAPGVAVPSFEERFAAFKDSLRPFAAKYGREMLSAFLAYWAEPDKAGQMRFEAEKRWNTAMRLRTWQNREAHYGHAARRGPTNEHGGPAWTEAAAAQEQARLERRSELQAAAAARAAAAASPTEAAEAAERILARFKHADP